MEESAIDHACSFVTHHFVKEIFNCYLTLYSVRLSDVFPLVFDIFHKLRPLLCGIYTNSCRSYHCVLAFDLDRNQDRLDFGLTKTLYILVRYVYSSELYGVNPWNIHLLEIFAAHKYIYFLSFRLRVIGGQFSPVHPSARFKTN